MNLSGVSDAFLDGSLTLHLAKGAKFDLAAVTAILESHGAVPGQVTEGVASIF